MVTAIGMITSIQSNTVVQYLLNNDQLGPVVVVGSKMVPYVLISGVFTFLYMFMPNTKVNLKSALVGGVAGGFMWATMSAVFTTFILYSTRTAQIYAGFAVAITTLIWLYLNWLILLIGSQLAFYHQRPAFLRIGRREPRLSNSTSERLALNVMYLVGQSFRSPGDSITLAQISQQLRIPSIALMPIVNSLENAHILIATENEELLPGREMTRIYLEDIMAIVRTKGETGSDKLPVWTEGIEEMGGQLDAAISSVIGKKTLADLLDKLAEDGSVEN
jgi:membrane protein